MSSWHSPCRQPSAEGSSQASPQHLSQPSLLQSPLQVHSHRQQPALLQRTLKQGRSLQRGLISMLL